MPLAMKPHTCTVAVGPLQLHRCLATGVASPRCAPSVMPGYICQLRQGCPKCVKKLIGGLENYFGFLFTVYNQNKNGK